MSDLLITLCARGGSKGIPGKNIRELGGQPLILYTLNIAREFSLRIPAHISLSTDNPGIRRIAMENGLATDYTRPRELATDTAGKIDAIHDLLLYEERRRRCRFEYILDLDITAPLRTTADLAEAFGLLRADPQALNIFSVNKAHRNPYFNQVEPDGGGYFRLVRSTREPIKSRQTAPPVYDLNASFYFYRRSFFDSGFANAYTDRSLIYLMPHICFDLDEPIDFEFLDFLISRGKIDFHFGARSS